MMNDSIEFLAESGQTMTEYAVVLGVITFVIVATLTLLSGAIDAAFVRTLEILDFAF